MMDSLRRSVVKLFVTRRPPNIYQPWDLGFQESRSGSACVVEGHRLLTSAHVVARAVHIQVMKTGDVKKYTARVEHVGYDSELALLTVDDERFFEKTTAVEMGELPPQHASISVWGFPTSGEELSVTSGGVSRIEVAAYAYSRRNLLSIQTDAAINPGNSGGPVFMDGKLIGIAFQSNRAEDAQKAHYLIPAPVIRQFYEDLADEVGRNQDSCRVKRQSAVPASGFRTTMAGRDQGRGWRAQRSG